MKKAVPYIIIAGMLVIVAVLIASGNRLGSRKVFDRRITLRQKDKIPYGLAAAKTLLPSLFPDASVMEDDKPPGFWNSMSAYGGNQAVIFVGKSFNADEFELTQLMNFVREGNHAFIIAKTFSTETQKVFGFDFYQVGMGDYVDYLDVDSVSLELDKKLFSTDSVYRYPGKRYESWFTHIDTTHTLVLGRNVEGYPDFIQLKAGKGTVTIHSAPVAFTNYFLLHKGNVGYFQKAFSVIPSDVHRVVWDEYYLNKKAEQPPKEQGLLRVLFRYPAFLWGLLVTAGILLIYMLMYMRRRQRYIPLHEKPRNESLDFVKTMGRLYYERKDHRNLALKMSMYFLEHVRATYKIPTHTLDSEFEQYLHFKSGYPQEEISEITGFIRNLRIGENVNENKLARFHSQLELFYQNT